MAVNDEKNVCDERGTRIPDVTIGMASTRDFTEREIAVLRELVTHASTLEIAERLGLSVDVVLGDIHEMLLKSGYNTRTRLAVEAEYRGIANREDDNPKQ